MTAITAVPSSAPATATAATSTDQPKAVENPGAKLDRDAFLKLLVAQLRNQDPSAPVDASQMVAQSAQLTMVDRLNDIADTLTSSAAGDRLAVAGGMIGREITFGTGGGVSTAVVESVSVDGDSLLLRTRLGDIPIDAVTGIRPGQVD
jgi:flagellar basal-body rod modification protein FlgD